MAAAGVILAALIVVGGILYLLDRLGASRRESREKGAGSEGQASAGREPGGESDKEPAAEPQQCCGLHLVCEKDLPKSTEPVYYDDEELDAFSGREASGYTEQEADIFRDVLYTLLPSDIAGWAASLELRGIALPEAVRDELLLIVAEARTPHPSSV